MKFKNKKTGEIVKANDFTMSFAYSHNSNYEKVEEEKIKKSEEQSSKRKKTEDEEESE